MRAGGGGHLWASASSADLRFWVRVSGVSDCEFVFAFGGLDFGFVVLCFMSLGSAGLPREPQIGPDSCSYWQTALDWHR